MLQKSEAIQKKYKLTPENIDAIAAEVDKLCAESKTDKKTSLRYRISAEECLNRWYEEFGCETEIELNVGKRFLKKYFSISAVGKNCNPYLRESETYGNSETSMLINIGLVPVYEYNNGKNTVTFTLNRKGMGQLLKLILIIAAAIIVGYVGKLFIPEAIVSILSDELFSPLDDTIFKMLSCISGPMIFLSVAWGVYGIGDVYTLGRIGKKMMLTFISVVFFYCIVGTAAYPFIGNGISATEMGNSQFGQIFAMLLDIFPSNIFSPFVEGNTLQIIFLGFIIGLSMIFLGQRTSSVARAVEQINYIINFLMSFISKLVPYFVFIVLVRLIWSDTLQIFASIWQLAIVLLISMVVINSMFLIYVSIRNKTSIFYLIRNALPSYLIALTTASSAATFESNISICKNKLGISNSMTSFGVPFGMVIFKPNSALYYLLICLYFTKTYNVQVSPGWLAIAVVVTVISAVATPPIPGGAVAAYTVLFLQLGIPTDALSIAIATDMLFDFFLTSSDMLCLLCELFNISGRLGMRDDEKIKSNQMSLKQKRKA